MNPGNEKQLAWMEGGSQPDIRPLKYGDVWRAARVWDWAFREDPVLKYIDAGVKESRLRNLWRRIVYAFALWAWIRTTIVITIDGGASVVVTQTPGLQSYKNKFLNRLAVVLLTKCGGMLSIGTKEERKRASEYRTKLKDVALAKLGDRYKFMMQAPLVMTAPESQGHGYASALLREMTQLADKRREAFSLVSINITNEGFYNYHGFQSVGEALIGDDNPTWDGPVLRVQVMVREPKT